MKRNTIARNTFYIFVSNVLIRGITAVSTIVVARYLGATDYGAISVALAWAAIAQYFTDMGVTQTLIREGTKPDAHVPSLLGGAFKLRIILAFGATAASLALTTLYSDLSLRTIVWFIVLPTIWGGALQGLGAAYYQMTQEMQYTALIRIVSGLVTAAALVIAVACHWSLEMVALTYGLSSLAGGAFSLVLVYRRVPSMGGWHSGLMHGLGAFTVGGVLLLFFPQLGPLTLQQFSSLQQVGYFAAASRIPSVLYQIPGMVATAFYPQLFHYGATDHDQHLRLSSLELKLMSLLAVGMALPLILYPHWILTIVLGRSWAAATSGTLVALSWSIILQGLNAPLADALTTRGLQSRRTVITGVAFAVAFVLYALLGTSLGAYGAALAAVGVQVVMLIGFTAANPIGVAMLSSGLGASCTAIILSTAVGLVMKAVIPFEAFGVVATPIVFVLVSTLVDRDIRFRVLRTLRITAG